MFQLGPTIFWLSKVDMIFLFLKVAISNPRRLSQIALSPISALNLGESSALGTRKYLAGSYKLTIGEIEVYQMSYPK